MEALGLNPLLLVAQVVSFLLLYLVFQKFLYGKIQSALKDRRDSIKKIFDDKEKIESRLKHVESELEEKRKEAQKFAALIEAEARRAAEETRKEVLEKAETEKERVMTKASEKIKREVEAARQQLKSEVKEMARMIVDKAIEEKTGKPDWQTDELNKSKKRLKEIKPTE